MTAIDPTTSLIANQASMAMSRGASLPGLGPQMDMASAKKAAQGFEAVFLSQMFGQMFQGLGPDKMFGGGQGEEMFRSMLLDEYSKSIVKRGGVGIADSVMHSLISQQEKRS